VDFLAPVLWLTPLAVEVPEVEAPVIVVVPTLVFVVEIFGFNDDGLFFGRSFPALVVPSTSKEATAAVFVSRPPSLTTASFSGQVVMV
jgi:hypothetical protein